MNTTYFSKHRKNLRQEGNKIISYKTHIATIDGDNLRREAWEIVRTWNGVTERITSSPTTSRHLNFIAEELNLNLI